jgi:hypothetical protein
MVQSLLRLANHCQFRTINVAIEFEHADSMKCLANAMDLMPNLHTVQIICKGHYKRRACCRRDIRKAIDTNQFLEAFGRHVYPSVKRAVLPIQAGSMLASLPAVVDVYINFPYSPHLPEFVTVLAEFATALAANCPVESLGWQAGQGVPTTGACMLFIVVSISHRIQW